ncbi:MAG: M13 family metallopeptidase [Rhodobacteraceae bacterium]|nr:M13 family metallopeptidase [Paracoccaceae bacterium]
MNKSRLVLLLVVSHALVLVAAWLYLSRPSGTTLTGGSADGGLSDTNAASTGHGAPNATPAPVPADPRTNLFHWSQVESTDYRKYISNLRGIGCPEETIKDFIMTDLMRHYAKRRGKLEDNGREFRFWETDERRALTAQQRQERDRELAGIDKELPAVLRELLGVNYERELNRYFVDAHTEEKRLAFLDPSKRDQVLVVRELVEEMRERLLDQIGKDGPNSEQQARLRAINDLHSGLLAQTLSREELEVYQMSTSPTADRLRSQLIGFAPTQEEFRRIFQLWQEFDRDFEFAGPEREIERAASVRKIEEKIVAQLDPQRAGDYQRARNPEYRDLVLFTQAYELPPATAQAIDDMRAAALNVRSQVLANQSLDASQRAAALEALQDEVQSSIGAALGEELYGKFTGQAGRWINTLGTGAGTTRR